MAEVFILTQMNTTSRSGYVDCEKDLSKACGLTSGAEQSHRLDQKRYQMAVHDNKHPELKAGEKYLGNYTSDGYVSLDFESKRMGRVALAADDSVLDDPDLEPMYPVFVLKSELKRKRAQKSNWDRGRM
jgi:hypothetical protein